MITKRLFGSSDSEFVPVQSGSGGASRHFYFWSDKPFKSKKIATSGEKFVGDDGKSHWTWELELFGTGKQVAAPPSIHPDTGKPYEWLSERPLSNARRVPSAKLAEITCRTLDSGTEDASGLEYLTGRLDWNERKIRKVLKALDHDSFCDDYEGWLKVGMALHHETKGSKNGLELWHDFSENSAKYEPDELDRRWRGFGRQSGNPFRFVSLVFEAGLESVEKEERVSKAKLEGLKFLTAESILALPQPFDWVRNVLYDNQLVIIYGEPGVAKSLFVLDLCARAALGLPWFGRETEQRNALYIALEGVGGLARRLEAWRVHNRQRLPPLTFATGFLALGTDKDSRHQIITHARDTKAKIVVIDTVARAMPGASENDPKDMGQLISGADEIRRETGATVILVAHSGKDASKGVRGHSSLKGAADVEIEITRQGEMRQGKVTKSKDGVEGLTFRFCLSGVQTDLVDARGMRIESVAVSESDDFKALEADTTKDERDALDMLNRISMHAAILGPPSLHEWRDKMKSKWSSKQESAFRMAWKRTLDSLKEKGLVVEGQHFEKPSQRH